MSKKVSVIIPFYQKHPGLLRRAATSALAQRGDFAVRLIVVDDGSPVSARSELSDLLLAHPEKVLLVEQRNAGCYPASNTALDHVPSDTSFVAFLDSDDEWTPDHLAHGVWALDHGFDLYFSDFYQLNQTVTAFTRARRIDPLEHPRIHPHAPIHEYCGDMVDQILRGNVLGTSTIVYSYPRLGHLRYLEDFRHTGPEYILWLTLARRSRRIPFSAAPECRYGGGVNIFSESAWGTDKYLSVRHDEIKWRKHVLRALTLASDQRRHIRHANAQSRRTFVAGLIHNLVHNGRVSRALLARQFRLDPLTFFILPLAPWRGDSAPRVARSMPSRTPSRNDLLKARAPVNAVTRLSELIQAIGVLPAFEYAITLRYLRWRVDDRGRLFTLHVKDCPYPVYARSGTSDLDVFGRSL